MNILVEFLTVRKKTGAGEYLRRVFFELCAYIERVGLRNLRLFALYDSTVGIVYKDLRVETLGEKSIAGFPITFVDCHGCDVSEIAVRLRIDVFYISCAQYAGILKGIENVKSRVVVTVHDLYGEEHVENRIQEYLWISSGRYDYRKRFRLEIMNRLRHLRLTLRLGKRMRDNIRPGNEYAGMPPRKLRPVLELFKNNANTTILTDSLASLAALVYHYPFVAQKSPEYHDRVLVLYPPSRIYAGEGKEEIENDSLRNLVVSGCKYFLVLRSETITKNVMKTLTAFDHYHSRYNDVRLVVLGSGKYNSDESRGVVVPGYLSDSDLVHAYRNCHAFIYPSVYEGFGYPPLEAMRFGKPVLCSNTTSMPEILGDAPIYFSPFYNSDIFRAMMSLTDEEYAVRSQKSLERFKLVQERQERDLRTLIEMILLSRNGEKPSGTITCACIENRPLKGGLE